MRGLDSVRDFYDELSGDYHLIYADWRNSVRRQGAVLDRIVRAHLGAGPHTVLDAACGIGTQAIGLALRGHSVHATDISGASVERARKEAADFGVEATFGVADLRRLGASVTGSFDVVVACDNALPHLVSDDELRDAAASVLERLRPGGLFVASTRDYDRVAPARPAATLPEVFDGPDGRRVIFQVWEWAPDGRTYRVNLFIVREGETGWTVRSPGTVYRALRRDELSEVLRTAGFSAIRWHTPAETGFFQPLVTARRP